jgi:hypothetical protein
MMQTTAVVVGAGHAGLAMSRRLTDRSIDHVVLERGEVANSWRTQRWPSLRLLTPNWQTRLPGHPYAGDDPDGFMPAADLAAVLTGYARLTGAPVCTAATVHTVRAAARACQWMCQLPLVSSFCRPGPGAVRRRRRPAPSPPGLACPGAEPGEGQCVDVSEVMTGHDRRRFGDCAG